MIEDFHFIRPLWLALLPVVVLIVWLLQRHHSRASHWRGLVDAHLLEALSTSGTKRRRWWLDLVVAGLVFAVIALAGPSLEKDTRPIYRKSNARMILFDISRSMNARDIQPSRLLRAKSVVTRILEQSGQHRTGLIAYAGDAWLLAPLTRDGNTLRSLLEVLETNVAPSQGSRPDRALLLARKLLRQSDAQAAEIIVISDGFKGRHTLEIAAQLKQAGNVVSVIMAGTAEGAHIPLPGGGRIRDFNNELVIAATDTGLLSELASAGGGSVFQMTDSLDKLEAWLTARRVKNDEELRSTDDEEQVVTWRDDGPWLLLPLLFIAALAFRRGWLMLLPVCVILMPAPAQAGFLDLFVRDDQQTVQAMARGDFDEAFDKAPDNQWAAVVSYRRGDYAGAALLFTDDPTADGHYNRGNALAMAGELADALEAYRRALSLFPDHEDAIFNYGLVQSLLEEQQEQEQDQRMQSQFDDVDGTGDDSDPANANSSAANTEGEDQKQADQLDEQSQAQAIGDNESDDTELNAAPAYSEDDAMSPEDVEIWLRRIPDDPSGLVRRKFAIQQHNRNRNASNRGQSW